jgi:hypothetical protein
MRDRSRDRSRPRSGALFSPLWLRPALWLRSDMGITPNGSNVAAWADQSGNGRHFVQNTAGAQPPYSASGGANGAPYLSIGNARFMQATTAASDWKWLHTPTSHVFIVTRASSLASFSTHLATCDGGIGRVGNLYRRIADYHQFVNVRAAGAPYPLAVTTSAATFASAWRFDEWAWSPGNATKLVTLMDGFPYRVDGTLAAAVDTANPSFAAFLGREQTGVAVGVENEYSEVIAFDRELTLPERRRVRNYLGARYALTVYDLGY